jgi:hypothetical protein
MVDAVDHLELPLREAYQSPAEPGQRLALKFGRQKFNLRSTGSRGWATCIAVLKLFLARAQDPKPAPTWVRWASLLPRPLRHARLLHAASQPVHATKGSSGSTSAAAARPPACPAVSAAPPIADYVTRPTHKRRSGGDLSILIGRNRATCTALRVVMSKTSPSPYQRYKLTNKIYLELPTVVT